MPRIAIIIGSNRPVRICPEIAQWVKTTAEQHSRLTYELVDLREVGLPFVDEPDMAALGIYMNEHTRRWSNIVSSYDGFIIVMPQYNWGYPAVVKNALDFLYSEWSNKPAGLVTYGTRGGGRAAAGLQIVLEGLHMRNTATNPALNTNPSQLDENRRFLDISAALLPFEDDVKAMASELATLIDEGVPAGDK